MVGRHEEWREFDQLRRAAGRLVREAEHGKRRLSEREFELASFIWLGYRRVVPAARRYRDTAVAYSRGDITEQERDEEGVVFQQALEEEKEAVAAAAEELMELRH